jgi:hypothetical protein
MEKTEIIKNFWEVYNEYIETLNQDLMPRLAELLSQIENKSKEQLDTAESVIAWQVLRNQEFLFCRGDNVVRFQLVQGELIIWFPDWDRDLFVSRFPHYELISGQILHPGYHCSVPEVSYEGTASKIYTDERGLYLPIYKKEIFLKLYHSHHEDIKKSMV